MIVYDREFPKGLHIFFQLHLNNGCHHIYRLISGAGSAKNLRKKMVADNSFQAVRLIDTKYILQISS